MFNGHQGDNPGGSSYDPLWGQPPESLGGDWTISQPASRKPSPGRATGGLVQGIHSSIPFLLKNEASNVGLVTDPGYCLAPLASPPPPASAPQLAPTRSLPQHRTALGTPHTNTR